MKKLDALIFILVTVLSLLPLAFMLQPTARTAVEICAHGEVIYRGALGQDAVITTPDGRNTVRIENGAAWMEHADCPDGLCLKQGCVRALRPIVCLPGEVVVRLIGEEAALDAISY